MRTEKSGRGDDAKLRNCEVARVAPRRSVAKKLDVTFESLRASMTFVARRTRLAQCAQLRLTYPPHFAGYGFCATLAKAIWKLHCNGLSHELWTIYRATGSRRLRWPAFDVPSRFGHLEYVYITLPSGIKIWMISSSIRSMPFAL